MANFLGNIFKDRGASLWEKEVKRAERQVWKERNGQLAPTFEPRDGVYEYLRRFDHKGKGRKGSNYHVVLRISFSPAPVYGWQITGVGTERLQVRGVEGGEPRRVCIDDGRVTSNGRFYWTENRGKLQHLVTGTLEPHYQVVNGFMCVDHDASFSAYQTISSSGEENNGKFTHHALKGFILQKDGHEPDPWMPKKRSAVHQHVIAKGQKADNPQDESLTEDATEFMESLSVTKESSPAAVTTRG
mmetsp:Transcript_24387/g.46399  ORF Transcript_24387/g.46399 Transcript_24387/m.46399 type:complete len:244 (+) Transcript_24387:150-881(+)|eukprot:scaffold1562_cov170-Amphora_coffeaeformis.AAC.8